jgi:CHAT domain-containing protein
VYLADRFAIAYLPSAALLLDLPPLCLNGQMLSLANPDRGRRRPLPFSDWEAHHLCKTLSLSHKEPYGGADATLDKTAHWDRFGLLHFSCHGLGMEQFAPLSHLQLADDLLLAHDVMYRRPDLHKGALVVLNGCQTGVRDWRAVDEGMGLMSAFLLRGAGLVLATQWSVLDHCAAEMVITFLTQLVDQGKSATEALCLAQQRARSITPQEIEARCQEVLQAGGPALSSQEAAQIHRLAALASRWAGHGAEMRQHGKQAALAFQRAGAEDEAQAVEMLLRDGSVQPVGGGAYDDPIYWAAFQLVGRVT